MKRILSMIMVIFLLSACLCSCGKEEKTDYYMIGYEAVEAGNYEKALSNFEIAAKEGDDQAAKAAKIVSSYLDAKEAYEVGNIDSAMNFLNSMPSDYKYYAIADDVDTLTRKVYGYVPQEAEDSEEADEAEEAQEEDTEEAEVSAEVSKKSQEFTAQQAMAYVSAKYGVQGDLGMGLDPSYTEDGEIYYEIVADVGKDGESDIKTLRIFSDGTILEK